ncbi:MAG: HEAT repeat domain-containing protein [Bacteroidetes bacterium]|nr:HEAT repeat domain-containing protein [Bacteroidota bacterium]MCW5895745.1 HEAT repeat domain-containing protein [Bacteroidota bacterium]
MKRSHILFLAALVLSAPYADAQAVYSTTPRPFLADASALGEGENEKDPAYKTYKEGYTFILADKWNEAMKKFAEVSAKFPKSEYLDDAAYWSAYAQKRLDRTKGLAAYEKFINDFPDSRYVDDAVADVNDNIVIVAPDGKNLKVKTGSGSYTYSIGTTMRESEKAMREAELAMRKVQRGMLRTPRPPRAPVAWSMGGFTSKTKDLDPKTRIKLDAIRALGESGSDKEAFATLKEIALDKSQAEIVRTTALESLSDFQKFEVLPVLIDVARTDASDEVQVTALYTIADLRVDKNKSTDALISLFNGYPKAKEKQLQTALYAIADVGNDKSVDFLVRVATTNDNYDLRSDAVYYLGSIGNEKSRAALMQILKSK